MTDQRLQGRRILLVEDEYFQAMEMKSFLESGGADVVGPTGKWSEVPALLEDNPVEAAVLDINLGSGPNFDVARQLREDEVPILFLTGYDESVVPDDLSQTTCLKKPASRAAIIDHLAEMIEHA
ncbi:response regulator [Altererythrobacter aurantiacus]|uniref:Response regulator n=1 Tax=Parapontixanthobacter aurantiacus TaxID=1463599 RepID=A0A844ZGF4_9SPHN|nr:response regulator [Parapontixanthobacter aurantiacus]MXO86047.1 response regulator [Parapontixanthobacter aurantiacus]